MILRAEQMFDKVFLDREHPSDFIDYVSYGVERELVNKVVDKLKDHKLFIVQLHEPGFIEDLPGSWHQKCAYRQDLECMEVVQCKNCRMNFPWCQKFRDELGGNGFCPYGAKMKGADDTPQITMCRDCDDYAGDGMYCASNFLVYDFSTSRENCETERSE